MTEINRLDERIERCYQEAERLTSYNKASELLADINYLKELRELRNKQELFIRAFDKIRAEIEEAHTYDGIYIDRAYVLEIIDKYKTGSEE